MTKRFAAITVALGLLGSILLILAVMAQTGGVFLHTLDDPYIHLALAEEIARGTYGINTGQPAAPSSSILYPFLLVLFGWLGDLSTLAMGLAGQVLMLAVLGSAIAAALGPRLGLLWSIPLAVLAALAVNAFALPLTGMEHTLHAGFSALVIWGLWQTGRGGRVPVWLVPALLLAAALRFEGFALGGLAALALIAVGHKRAGAAALIGLALLGAGFVAAMLAMGLPPLPSSVMVKSDLSAAAVGQDGRGLLVSLIVNLLSNLQTAQGAMLAVCALVLGGVAWMRPGARLLAVPAALAVVAHLVLGRFGWFARYEVYAVALALTALVLTLRPRPLVVALMLVPFAIGYLDPLRRTPAASVAVYQQQFQMARFAHQFFPQSVAVNDLGLVALHHPAEVIDLWGLGSEEARRLTAAQGRTPETLLALTEGRATYAMIYDPAFSRGVPETWCRMATLDTSLGALAWDSVSFYLIDPTAQGAMAQALATFAPTLPGGALMTLYPCER